MIRLLTIPFIGLFYFAQSIRAGFESKFGMLIVRMTWVGRQRKLYMLLVLPYVMLVAAESWVTESVVNLGGGITVLGIGLNYGLLLGLLFESGLSFGDLLAATAMALGIRNLLASKLYREELRVSLYSRKEIFQTTLATYFPLLLLLYFAGRPLGQAFGKALADGISLNTFHEKFSSHFIDLSPHAWWSGGSLALIFAAMRGYLSGWLMYCFFFYLKLFSIVGARSAGVGILRAVVYTTVASLAHAVLWDYWQVEWRKFYIDIGIWSGVIPYVAVPILGLGIVWQLALRRFDAGPLPIEEDKA